MLAVDESVTPAVRSSASAVPGRAALGPDGSDAGGGTAHLAAWIAVATAGGLALGPLLGEFGRRLWATEHYRFAPLLLLAVSVIGARRFLKAKLAGLTPGRPAWRALAWGFALLTAAGAVAAGSPFVAAIATLILLAVTLYETGGARLLRRLLPVWGIAWLAVPPPFNWDGIFIVRLQKIATSWASGLLELSGTAHLADGVVIRLSEREFFVDEACSGVHSLFASLAATAVIAVLAGRGVVRTPALLAAAVFWVLVGNACRVFAVVELSTRHGLPVASGWRHELLGLLVFTSVVGIVVSTDRLLLFLLPVRPGFFRRLAAVFFRGIRPERHGPSREPSRPRGVVMAPVLVASGLAVIAFGGFLIPAAANPAFAFVDRPQTTPEEGLFRSMATPRLPASWEGWTRSGFEVRERTADDPAGNFSTIWHYRKGRLNASISVDGPYEAWHDLSVCYDGLGYSVASWRDRNLPESPSGAGQFTELEIEKDGRHHGLVLFAAYAESGRALATPRGDLRNPLSRRLAGAIDRWAGGIPKPDSGERVYQIQLFSDQLRPFTSADLEELNRLYHEMRRRIIRSDDAPRDTDGSVKTAASGLADGTAAGVET